MLVADIGLLGEEREIEAVLTVKDLVRLQFHRTGVDTPCPASGNGDVHILIEKHLSVRTQVTEIHWTFPVTIVVTWLILSVTGLTIRTVTITVNTDLRIREVPLVTHDADDRDGIFIVRLDIAAGYRDTGQVAVLKQTEHVVGGLADSELPLCTDGA